MTQDIRTCLWFDGSGGGIDAARHYVALFPDSGIDLVLSRGAGQPPFLVNFRLKGTPYQILDAGPAHPQTPAASIAVLTDDQAETDRLWSALTEGGAASRCGWLTDRWGVSWQIIPEALPQLLQHPDATAAARVTEAMLGMGKIVVAELEAAAAGVTR